ncbi:hypothetical protein MUK42_14474 [Musa troglodytarum]|uniref:BZIP domain-containing protein n=1 Tax=Musa troglodytarum TaxID=320322 RepID=A0A9E7IK64_9LILI|nr:hypothetical protein MUK42_14474 [Musa troglodytarum]
MEPSGAPTTAAHRFGQIPPQPPPNPRGGTVAGAHRRALSETFLHLSDDLLFDTDPDCGISDIDFPSLSDDNVSGGGDIGGYPAPPAVAPAGRPVPGAHLRSLSVDNALFEGMGFQAGAAAGGGGGGAQERMGHHRRSGSMDGSISPFEGESAPPLSDYAKKAMTADKLAELSLLDPRRAKRHNLLILANRQSAARSKERKVRYTNELERKVQTLQTEATTLSAQLTLLQRDTTDLTAENRELKLRLQAMEQQAQLRNALNEALREEVQRLKIATGQLPNANGNPFNGGIQQSVPNYYSQPQQLRPPSGRQVQHLHPSPTQMSSNGQSLNAHSPSDPMDFM